MKILFAENSLRTDKLGIMQLSAILKKKGHHTILVQDRECPIESMIDVFHPEFIFYSVMTGDHQWALKKNQSLKEHKFAFTSVMGGPHFTFFPEDGVDNPYVDITVIGPGETVIDRILERNDSLIHGSIPDIQRLPIPDRILQYSYKEFGQSPMKRFMACRDCPNSCKYCFNHLYRTVMKDDKDRFYQSRTPQQMMDEIESVRFRFGMKLAYFNDDDLAHDYAWISEFCDLIKDTDMNFCGSARANSLLQEDTIKMLADSGCTFMNIAIESSVPETQKLLRRGNVNNEQILDACQYCEESGIKIRLQNMIGLPVDDPLEDALQTLEFNQKANVTDSWAAIFQPFPKTDLHTYCQEKNLLKEGEECKAFYESSPLNIQDRDKIQRLHKWWHIAAKYKIPIDAVREIIEIPIGDETSKYMQDLRWEKGAKLLYGM